jgi:hypothetical protein
MTIELLKPSGDRKTRSYDSQKNTFGLLPGLEGSCPCATTSEGGCWSIKPGRKLPDCYVANVINIYKGVRDVLAHNTRLLKSASEARMVTLLSSEFKRFKDAEAKRAKHGLPNSTDYRLHWSGDIFNETYARAIAAAIKEHPDLNFWCYTRSFFAVKYLADIPNLNLYLSLDPVNIHAGLSVFNEYKRETNNLQICYMSPINNFQEHVPRADTILQQENELRGLMGDPVKPNRIPKRTLMSCPVDTGNMALENGCAKCTNCLKRDSKAVWFKS